MSDIILSNFPLNSSIAWDSVSSLFLRRLRHSEKESGKNWFEFSTDRKCEVDAIIMNCGEIVRVHFENSASLLIGNSVRMI